MRVKIKAILEKLAAFWIGICIAAILLAIGWLFTEWLYPTTHWESQYEGTAVSTIALRAGEWQMQTLDNVCTPHTCFFLRTSDYMHPEFNFSRRPYLYFEPDGWVGFVTVYQKFSVSEDTTATLIDRCADIRPTPIIQGARRVEEGEDGYNLWLTTYNPEWRM